MKCAKLTFHWKGFTWVHTQNTDITLPLWTPGWGRGWAHCPTYGILARLCGCASLLSFLPPCTCLWCSTWPLTLLKTWRLSTGTEVRSCDQDRQTLAVMPRSPCLVGDVSASLCASEYSVARPCALWPVLGVTLLSPHPDVSTCVLILPFSSPSGFSRGMISSLGNSLSLSHFPCSCL